MRNHTKKKSVKATDFHNPKNLDAKCAGIDIGADSIYVCALSSTGKPEVKEFPVFTQDLLNMCEWLKNRGVESVAMESTGVFWTPCFEILEENGFEAILVNPYLFKCVPGRKTDVKDAQWIQQLHSHGLLGGSFRPTDEYVRLRAIIRQRANLFQEGARQIQHMHKALTQMNIQLRIAISDITGTTGLAIIQAIIAGERDPLVLAALRNIRCKKEEKEIARALNGNWREEHVFILKQSYEAYEFYHKQINKCEIFVKQFIEELPPNIGAYYRRMRSKFGPAKAITATAHKLAVIIYIMIKNKKSYKELGGDYFEKKYKERRLKTLEKQAKEFGYELKIKAA